MSPPEDDDDLDAEEQENLEEELVDQATAAQTIAELESEIESLKRLEQQASELVASGVDRKWEELSKILQNDPHMRDSGGRLRKLIIFTEHRDTLNYLNQKIAGVLGNAESIAVIHGGTHRDERRRLQALFRSDPDVRVLLATDAAGDVKFINPVAESLTGWTQEQATGTPLDKVFVIVNEETRKPVSSPFFKVVSTGKVVGLANHTVLIARDGTEHAIADSGAPILDRKKDIAGVVIVFRKATPSS